MFCRFAFFISATVVCLSVTGIVAADAPSEVSKQNFGETYDGKSVDVYTLKNSHGASIDVMTYGATLTKLVMPDREGKLGDVVLGSDTMGGYEKQAAYFGATIGRFANRIAGGKFSLDGKNYQIPVQGGGSALHGGRIGYNKRIWTAEPSSKSEPSVQFTLTDPDGTEGFPGTVQVQVIYTLTENNTVRIAYEATTDKATPINLTNHSYFNLKDGGKSSVGDTMLRLFADQYTPFDSRQIPTGEIASVKGTPFDFTSAKKLSDGWDALVGNRKGFDHNFVLGLDGSLREAAAAYEPTTGRIMQVWTTQPGVQLYTPASANGPGKAGITYGPHPAFCLETEHYPDSINQPSFPSTVLRPGQTLHEMTEYRFSTRD